MKFDIDIIKDIRKKRKKRIVKIKVKWTPEMVEDLSQFYGIDINSEVEQAMVDELKKYNIGKGE